MSSLSLHQVFLKTFIFRILQLALPFDELLHEHVLAIEHGIREVMNPIAEDENARRPAQHQVEHDMTMPIDEEIDVGMRLQIILGVEHKRFFMLAHVLRLTTILALQAAMLGPFQTEIHAPTRMKHREEELQRLTTEHGTKHLELPVLIPQSISMRQIEFLSINFACQWFAMNDDATFFLQVITTPYVMVANEKMHFHSQIGQLRNLTQKTSVTLWHHQLELIPKIEHIAQQIDSTRLMLDAIEEIHQSTFLRTAMFNGT